ncbi:hypothetical protein PVOR_14404 [Paenibacillus vortex V453]|uniref:Uncharacterized protein n=1 Tax=Paenibacillus vortex V453 TaxID=715225 RepID=A0A2R9SW30_9BACL|nr:hypothetical protein [Paenibacillus vortex]EFU41552.1 hypothetical protein PVOR_14404 [Paenibacillus vortex V453]
MNEEKPDWYERAQQGPFQNEPFTAEMKNKVQVSLTQGSHRSKRRPYLRVGMTGVLLFVILLLLIQFPWGERTVQQHTAGGGPSPSVTETIRAEGTTDEGTLQVVAVDKEEITELGAPSCFGLETDLSFKGDYKVKYTAEGTSEDVVVLEDLTFIQPTSASLQMIRLPFQEADVFILAPQYKDCHGIQIYAFAVEHGSGKAVQLQFEEEFSRASTSYYRPGTTPTVKDNKLVLKSTEGPGGEGSPEYNMAERMYQLDLRQNAMVMVLRKDRKS